MKKLYCFDFDGTLTRKDTMFAFLKYYQPRQYYFQFLKFTPLFILVKLKLADAAKVKQGFISAFLKGKKEEELRRKAQSFFEEKHSELLRPEAVKFINQLDLEHNKGLLVTASLDIWAKPFAHHFNLQLVATRAGFFNGKYAGTFIGENCNGPEKVNRILKEIQEEKFDKTIAFGDTSGDEPMLSWADESYYRYFN